MLRELRATYLSMHAPCHTGPTSVPSYINPPPRERTRERRARRRRTRAICNVLHIFLRIAIAFLRVAGKKLPKLDPWDIPVAVDQKTPYSFINNSLAG